jgi:DUF883 C-terminal glycine zipper region
MTDQPRSLVPAARDSLRARIEAAERRNAKRTIADQAREAASAAADYTRANPLTVIGGALAVGLVIGLLTPPGRRVARQVASSATGAVSGAASSATSGVKRLAASGGSRIGTLLGEAAVAYIMTMIDDTVEAASTGRERAGEIGDAASDKARGLARKSRDTAGRMVAQIKRKTKG